MVSEKAYNARMANLRKAHENIRKYGPTADQREASRHNIEKAHEKIRREGLTEKQRDARSKSAKEMWMTRPRQKEARAYALSFTDSLDDAIGFETSAIGDARLTARDIAMDEFSSVNRDALRRWLSADSSKFKNVDATVWVYDKDFWRMIGRVSVTFHSIYKPMVVLWYDPKRGDWCNITYAGAIAPVKGD